MCLTAIIPLGDGNQWGASLKIAPSPPFLHRTSPPTPSYEEGTFQDGRNTEVLMKNAESDKNQLTIKIDRRQNLLLERWPPIWPKAMD